MLRARMRLIVATKLQWDSKHNTLLTGCVSWVIRHLFRRMMHIGLLLISMMKYAFHFATFVLRSVRTNQHNWRQGCNLDELINQSEPTQARHSHVWVGRCYRSKKINKDKLIKVTIGLAGPMREGDMIRCLLMSQRSGIIDNGIQKSSKWLQSYTHVIQDSKAYTSSREQRKQVVAMMLSRIQSMGN
jgi:hypothetical protein